MKTIKTGLLMLMCLLYLPIFGQVPQSLNYQAVVRDGNGNIMTSSAVDIRLAILDGSTAIYEEMHTATTTDNGLLNLIIGDGLPITGTFPGIDWSTTGLSLKVEVDIGAGFVDMGTTELESVPYALYADEAMASETATYADTATVALTAQNAVWQQGTGGSISYTDTVTATSYYVASIATTHNLNPGNNLLRLYTPSGGASNFNFIRMDHGLLVGSDVATIKGDGTAYFTKLVATQEIGELGVPQAGTTYPDNTALAWAYISSTGTILSSFGVQSVTDMGPGIFYVYLDNAFQGYPAVSVNGYATDSQNLVFANINAIPNSNEIRVYTGTLNASNLSVVDKSFYMVVFGRPQ